MLAYVFDVYLTC